MPGTIRATAHNAGSLDLKMQPERHNTIRVLLFLDIGGSMDDHVRASEELFSAARSEFRQLAFFYFHNCPYERVWTDNRRRAASTIATDELLRTYGADYRAIFVGDATMSPYEIAVPGGSVEHWNEQPGSAWITRMTPALAPLRLAQPGPAGGLALHPVPGDDPRPDGGAHVPPDPRRNRRHDQSPGQITRSPFRQKRTRSLHRLAPNCAATRS